MEQELQSTVIKIAKKHSDVLAEKTGVDSSMIESDVKEDMAMVLRFTSLEFRENSTRKQDNGGS
jgi:flagellar biosynthesis/type III secretory pathway protein FliH